MGLLSIIRKLKAKERDVRILLLGLDNAGKTTTLKKFIGEPIDTVSPTLAFNIQTLEHKGYNLNVWDIGGQKSLRSYWKNYYEVTEGIIWVVDSADRLRLEDCKNELHQLLQEERLYGASLLVFANKQDIGGALSCNEIAEVLELNNITKRHWAIFSCSAMTGHGLEEGIDWIVGDISSRLFLQE
eukprot:TRINITY_DN10143_c0_g1_i1.p1 TRINITY_DN10143_c0_g1~~TRINITY_DN10143_c0_g1_i1.p1  ORF type:complete len:198 (+),score=48.78 TRINITY_DN10143_c0_g1_i1:42-596(+)